MRRFVHVAGALSVLVLLAVAVVVSIDQSNFRAETIRPATHPFKSASRINLGGLGTKRASVTPSKHLVKSYGNLPLSFEANVGQTDGQVKFLSRGKGYGLFLTGSEAVLTLNRGSQKSKVKSQKAGGNFALLRPSFGSPVPSTQTATPSVLRMKVVGANSQAAVKGLDQLPGHSNYYIGNDPKKWRTNVPSYAKVKYEGVYPGVDLVYYGNQRQLEYDFVVAPGADASTIALGFETGNSKLETGKAKIDARGDLVIATEAGEVRFHKPAVYQVENPKSQIQNRKSVDGRFKLLAANRVGFELGAYDKTRPLVIDPALSYATYLGGSDIDVALDIKADSAGNAYVVGSTASTNFDTTIGPAFGGGFDAFVTKLNPDGTALVYSTFVGGDGGEDGNGIAIDALGNAFVTGATDSANFPMATFAALGSDAFFFKLDTTGALVYSKLYGGTGQDGSSRIAVDASENVYFTGPTTSTDLPITNGFQAVCSSCVSNSTYDAFVAVFRTTGPGAPARIYTTYLGGDSEDYPHGIALDSTGKIWVIGSTVSTDFPTNPPQSDPDNGFFSDAFLTYIDPTQLGLASLLLSSYVGDVSDDSGYAVAVGSDDMVYIAGHTNSPVGLTAAPGFSTTNAGGLDVYVAKIDPNTATAIYGTFIGGSMGEQVTGIAVDNQNPPNAYVTGFTFSSTDFPLVNAVDSTFGTGFNTGFVTQIAPDGMSLPFSSYLGGNGGDVGQSVAVDPNGNIYVAGSTNSPDFPVTGGAYRDSCGDAGCSFGDGFVAKINIAPADGPKGSVDPATKDFGEITVGNRSNVNIHLTNTGNQPLTIDTNGIVISGAGAVGYSIVAAETNCVPGTPIAAAASCNIVVRFEPGEAATFTAKLQILSNALNSPNEVPLTGVGLAGGPVISLEPTSVDFGNQLVGLTSSAHTVTLRNTGTATLNITGITKSGENIDAFTITNTCGTSVAADGSCTISATFGPTAPGSANATINIASDATSGPNSVSLDGNGVDLTIAPGAGSSTSATVAAGATATYGLTILGTAGVTGNATLACSGAPATVTCTPTPTVVILSETTPAPFTVSAGTMARSLVAPVALKVPPAPWWKAPVAQPINVMGLLALLAMAGLALASRRRARWLLAATMLVVLMWSACDNNNNPPPQTGTPAGTYTLTITATTAAGAKSIPLTLTVN